MVDRSSARILLSAGEASGDRLGAGLARALKRRRPDLELLGMGGGQMRAAGVRLVQQAEEVAVVGIFEVLSHLPAIRRAMARLEAVLADERPDLVVPIDFPDFNLRLAARATAVGVPVVYYVSPQVWAWRGGRVHRIKQIVRRILVLFRFEVPIYEDVGLPVTFVGHPVVEESAADSTLDELRDRAGLDPGRPTVALLPGSRRTEVSRQLPRMLDAAARLRADRPGLQLLVPRAPGLDPSWLVDRLRRPGLGPVQVHADDFPSILRACTAGAVAAGTATLEAGAVGLPMVVVYRMNPFSYAIGRSLVRLDHVALPNLVAGRRIVPELIQREFTADRLATELGAYLDDPEKAQATRLALGEMRRLLGEPGAFDRAAEAVLAELDAVRGH
jgi:lipid-A-disaccharide synthase